jgi:hypothetical protein
VGRTLEKSQPLEGFVVLLNAPGGEPGRTLLHPVAAVRIYSGLSTNPHALPKGSMS